MIEQLLAEGKLEVMEADSLFSSLTYRYCGFVVVQWAINVYCIRPLEVGHIPGEVLNFFKVHHYSETHHRLLDGAETACLCAINSLAEILADIDSWWESMRGPSLRR